MEEPLVGSASKPTVGVALCVSAGHADDTHAGTEIMVAIRWGAAAHSC